MTYPESDYRDRRRTMVADQLDELRHVRAYLVETHQNGDQLQVIDAVIADLEERLNELRGPTVWEHLLEDDGALDGEGQP